jgi:DNA-binding MarR family transcriptional regulator
MPELSDPQRKVLEALSGGVALNASELLDRTRIAPGGLTPELIDLERAKLVERFVDQSTGGEVLWRATTAGLESSRCASASVSSRNELSARKMLASESLRGS